MPHNGDYWHFPGAFWITKLLKVETAWLIWPWYWSIWLMADPIVSLLLCVNMVSMCRARKSDLQQRSCVITKLVDMSHMIYLITQSIHL